MYQQPRVIETEIVESSLGPASLASVLTPLNGTLCLLLADILSIALALSTASALWSALGATRAVSLYHILTPAFVVLLCSFTLAGLYPGISLNPIDEVRICTFATTLGYLSLAAGTFFAHDLSQSRAVYVVAYVITLVLVPFCRSLIRGIVATRMWWGAPVAIIGFGPTGQHLLTTLRETPRLGFRPVVVFEENGELHRDADRDVLFLPLASCSDFVKIHNIKQAIICMPESPREAILELVAQHRQCFRNIVVIPNLMGMSTLGTRVREIGGLVGLEVSHNILSSSSKTLKRTLDIVISLSMMPLVLLILAVFGLLVKLEDGGKLFYASRRIGYDGRSFTVWKLRSMVANGEGVIASYLEKHPEQRRQWEETQKLKRDPRLTRIGAFIRKTSIDELPQLWNVLTGEMSLVGPRPILAHQIPLYGASFLLYKQVAPGITGLWQISGRNHLSFAERVKLDKYVIENWSIWLDIYILARTLEAVFRTEGAY